MLRRLVILLLSVTCVGCPPRRPPVERPPSGLPAGKPSVVVFDADLAALLERTGRYRPAEVRKGSEDACVRVVLTGAGATGSSTAIERELFEDWRALRSADDTQGWLLSGLGDSEERLRFDGSSVVACTPEPHTVEFWRRWLSHPYLWIVPRDESVFDLALADPIGFLSGAAPERFDLAVAHGNVAGRLRETVPDHVHGERLQAWDRTYALWIHPGRRWVNDPTFRRWISGAIDREAMARLLFDEHAEAENRLEARGRPGVDTAPTRRPMARTSTPRLTLGYSAADPDAARIAARVKAVLAQQQVELQLRGLADDVFAVGLAGGEYDLTLITHHPPVADPVMALQHTFWPLGGAAEDAWAVLERAERHDSMKQRQAQAPIAEDMLLGDARLVPLVRVHAWLFAGERGRRLRPGPWGVLDPSGGGP